MDLIVAATRPPAARWRQVVFDNAAQSVLPSLVPPDLLPKANGTQYVVQVIGGSFLGPPAGAALFAIAPFAPFGVDAVSFAGSAALLRGLPAAHPSRGRSSERGSAWNVVTVSLRQRVIPSELLGRVNSVYRMLDWGTIPLGGLAGGFIASVAGLRAPYVISGVPRGAVLLLLLPALLAAARTQEPDRQA
jgi:hypothetical protein